MALVATELFIGKFVSMLESEAASIAGFRDQVDEIKRELVIMKSFLEDADGGKKAHTEVKKAQVASIRDLANDVENIIDEFMYHMYKQQRGSRCPKWLLKTIHFPKHLWYKRQIAKKLQKIAGTIRAIPERNERYGGAAAIEEKSTSEYICRWGWEDIREDNSSCKDFHQRDLLRRLIKEFHKAREEVSADMNAMCYIELVEILVNYLETKRYLDVWDILLWERIRLSFPDKQLGSRVMLTTRREDIGSYSFGVESHVHKIQPLERRDAWELFSMKAFSSYHNKSCSPEGTCGKV
ncbi:unnamed protein product [Prunus armeniaca]